MKESKRRRYKYEILINGKAWTQATTMALAEAAARAAARTWAKGSTIVIVEIKDGAFSPFTEAQG